MSPLYTCMWNSITTGRVGVEVGMEVGVGGAVTAPHVSPVVDEASPRVCVELGHHGRRHKPQHRLIFHVHEVHHLAQ